ncbi:hypothetical protein J3459_012080 [Metarhizium acridum]|nr:hypothetical protein J3459_012080 [Metarhizium acridum]
MERLSSMTDKFQREQDMTYRDQLQKIQYEIGLVQRFDPYDPNALEVAAELQREHRQTQGPPVHAESARSLMDMAGINTRVQEYPRLQGRDGPPRAHGLDHHFARPTHQHPDTKKNRLNREKEVLEINDSNALLLNPNHFSLTNPGSPGGTHGKRATRLRKDADDLQMFSDKKRKRNPGEDDGSPGPMRRGLDPNSTTPLWQSEKARAVAKQNGPIYSIDKLFTDKELSLHYNSAALAAHQYILRNRVNGNASSPDDSDSGNGDDNDADSVPSAPMMERQVSHATRSTRGGTNTNFLDDKILGVEGIANFEVPANLDLMHAQEPPKMPPHVPQQYLKPYPRSADQNFPVPLSQDDIVSDLSVMGFLKQYDHAHKPGAHLDAPTGLRKILEAVSIPVPAGPFRSHHQRRAGRPRKLSRLSWHPHQRPARPTEPRPRRLQPVCSGMLCVGRPHEQTEQPRRRGHEPTGNNRQRARQRSPRLSALLLDRSAWSGFVFLPSSDGVSVLATFVVVVRFGLSWEVS